MRKKLKKLFCSFLLAGLVVSTPLSPVMSNLGVDTVVVAEAAAKPKMSYSKKTVYEGSSTTLTLKNVKSGVKWYTSNKKVATIKAKGTKVKVTGKKAGKVTITAKYKNKNYKCTVTVKAKPALSATKKTLSLGQTYNLSIKNAGSSAKWYTSNKKVVAIKKVNSTKYKLTAKKAGTAKITVKYGGKKYTCKVTVKTPVLTDKSKSLKVEDDFTLSLSNGTSSAKWSVSDSSVLKLKEVKTNTYTVTGVGEGTAKVNVSLYGKTYSCTVKVSRGAYYASEYSKDLLVGNTFTLSFDNDGESKEATWKVSDSSVVSLKKFSSNRYIVTGLKAGKATITITYRGKDYYCYVVVKKPNIVKEVKLSKTSLSLNYGTYHTLQLENLVGDASWDISDSSIADISHTRSSTCEVKAKREGTAVITATSGTSKYTCKLTVVGKNVSLNIKEYEVFVGKDIKIDLNGNNSIAEGWKSSNTSVATVDYRGYVQGRSEGKCDVSVYVGGKLYKFPITVKEEVTVETEEKETEINTGTEKPEPETPETEKESETVVSDKYNFFWDNTFAGGREFRYQIVTDKPVESFDIGISGNGAIITNIIKSGRNIDIFVVGRTKGESLLIVKEGGVVKASSHITITSDDNKYLAYSYWKDTVKIEIGFDKLASAKDKLQAVGNYICKRYDYVASNWDYMCFAEGYGGSCFAASALICDFATDLGLECRIDHVYGRDTHVCAVVNINGTWWYFDAGTGTTAGNRSCSSGTLK